MFVSPVNTGERQIHCDGEGRIIRITTWDHTGLRKALEEQGPRELGQLDQLSQHHQGPTRGCHIKTPHATARHPLMLWVTEVKGESPSDGPGQASAWKLKGSRSVPYNMLSWRQGLGDKSVTPNKHYFRLFFFFFF